MMNSIPTLPSTLSGLLRLALADANRLDPDHYYPRWDCWHVPDFHEQISGREACLVNLAGAVLAGTFAQPPDHEIHEIRFDELKILGALDCISDGDFQAAWTRWYETAPTPDIAEKLDQLSSPQYPKF